MAYHFYTMEDHETMVYHSGLDVMFKTSTRADLALSMINKHLIVLSIMKYMLSIRDDDNDDVDDDVILLF